MAVAGGICLAIVIVMRLLLFLFGIALGVAGTLGYAVFAHPAVEPVAQPLPASSPIAVTLGEGFLTGILQRGVLDTPGVSVPRGSLRAELRDDAIVVHANVEVLGKATDGQAVLRPVLRGGKLAIDVVDTNLGTLPLPALDDVLDRQINARINSLLAGMPVTITGVRVERDRGMTVTCQVDLDRLQAAQVAR